VSIFGALIVLSKLIFGEFPQALVQSNPVAGTPAQEQIGYDEVGSKEAYTPMDMLDWSVESWRDGFLNQYCRVSQRRQKSMRFLSAMKAY
jgi:hypothetical protein